jgi:hypothetical protein
MKLHVCNIKIVPINNNIMTTYSQLIAIDIRLQEFAQTHNAILVKDKADGHWVPLNYDSRRINFTQDNFDVTISIYPNFINDNIKNWDFTLYIKSTITEELQSFILANNKRVKFIIKNIDSLLEQSNNIIAMETNSQSTA